MSVDKLPSGKWRARWPGMPSKSFTLKGDAETYERKLKRAKETGRGVELLDAEKKTLATFAAEHLAAEWESLSPKTRKTYRTIWSAHVDERILGDPDRQVVHAIASMPTSHIRPKDVEAWRDSRLKAGAGPSSIRKTMALMQTILDRAIRDEAMAANPVKAVKKPSGKKQSVAVVIPPSSVEAIRAELDDSSAALVSLLAYAGLRPGEARALRWQDIGERTIHVVHGTEPDGTIKLTKTEERRNVRLVTPLADDLKARRKALGNPPDSALVFARADGAAWTEDDWNNWRGRKFAPALAAAGVAIDRPYDLRHSAASLWLHESIVPTQVAEWMGHDFAMLASTYAHVIAELDPAERVPADEAIAAARGPDTSVTPRDVERSPTGSRRSNGRKSRKRGPRAEKSRLP